MAVKSSQSVEKKVANSVKKEKTVGRKMTQRLCVDQSVALKCHFEYFFLRFAGIWLRVYFFYCQWASEDVTRIYESVCGFGGTIRAIVDVMLDICLAAQMDWILQNDEDKSVQDYKKKKSNALDEVNKRKRNKPLKPNPVFAIQECISCQEWFFPWFCTRKTKNKQQQQQ